MIKLKIIDHYIAKQIILMVGIVAFALLGFDLFFKLVEELKNVGHGNYTLSTLFFYLMLTIPTRLYTLFPWAALLGSLIALGALANHSELIVMRAAGISVARITWSVLKAALWVMIVVIAMGEGIAPTTERLASDKRTFALSGGQTLQTDFGLWVRQGQEFIHIQTLLGNGDLSGITRYQFNANRGLEEALFAKTAQKVHDGWLLEDVSITQFVGDHTEKAVLKTQTLPVLLDPNILETALVKHPERLSLMALFKTIQNRSQNALSSENYELAFFSKIFQPLVILMMVFLGVPFVFGPLRTGSQGRRMVVGILVAFLFHTLNSFFAPLAVVYQLPPVLAVLLPIVLFSIIGLLILRRA